MTTIVAEIYEALKSAGIDEHYARAAAAAVIGVEEKTHLATKADLAELKADFAMLKAEIFAMLNRQLQVMMAMMVAMTGIFAAIVKLL